jgi:hypothetical protein
MEVEHVEQIGQRRRAVLEQMKGQNAPQFIAA